MLRRVAVLLALLLFACSTGGGSASRRSTLEEAPALPNLAELPAVPSRVVLVSVAGLVPDHYRRAGLAGGREPVPMRTLARLAEVGVFADHVTTVFPAAVHPVNATLVTGRTPVEHGVVADQLLGDRGVRSARYDHASRLQGPSLWQVAQDAGLGVAILGWPTTLGANVDFLLPDVVPSKGESWLDAIRGASTPWLFERAARRAPSDAPVGWPSAAQRDHLMVDLACDLARSETLPALWLMRLEGGAAAQIGAGPGTSDSWRAFVAVDRQLARLANCFSRAGLLESTAIVVVGDRVIEPVHTRIDPNAVLVRAGLIQPRGRGIEAWSAIARSSGGSALVYARSEDDAIAARRALGVAADESRGFRVAGAAELRERGADPRAWFGIDALPGYRFGNGAYGPLAAPSLARGAGGHPQQEGGSSPGFVAFGPGLRQQVRIADMDQLDIGPTVAQLLGLRLPDARGRALLGALDPLPENVPAALR